MQTLRSKVVVDGLLYAEGIRWAQGKVWFSDMLGCKVYAYDPATGRTEVVVETPDRPSGLGFLPDGRLLIATTGERKLLRLDPGGLTVVADLSSYCRMLNDMVVDPQGRAYIDGYLEGSTRGMLLLVEPDGASRVAADDMASPNGLVVTPDGATLIANDLYAHQILAFDIGADGALANRRVFADLGDGCPDGLCLDAEGAVWVGLPFENRFRRIKPGGEATHEIVYDNKWGVAPVLGGADRRTLYLCTAEVELENLVKQLHGPLGPSEGCRAWIEAVEKVEVPGAGWP